MSFAGVISIAAGALAGTLTAWTVLATVAVTALSHISAAKQRKRQVKLEREAAARADAAKGFTIVTEATVQTMGVAYGRNKVGGLRVWFGVASTVISPGEGGVGTFFGSSGSASDLSGLMATATTYDLRVSLYVRRTGSVVETDGSGNPLYYTADPLPYVWGEGESLASSGSNASVDFTSNANSRVQNFTIAAGGQITRVGTVYRLTLASPGSHTAKLPANARVAIRHDSFFRDVNGNVVAANLDSQQDSTVGSGYHDYTVTSYNSTTGELTLSGPDLTGTAVVGSVARPFTAGRAGTANEALFFKQVLCYEGIERVVAVEINGEPIETPKFDSRVHVFNSGGVVDPWISTNFPAMADGRFHLAANASVICWLNREDPQFSGIPDVSFYLEGMKVYDIYRNDTTYTLSGAKSYSNNPARVLLDYLLSKEYGKGLDITDIDLPSFWNAARICNRLVQVNGSFYPPGEGLYWQRCGVPRTLHLYECNLMLDTGVPVRDNIEIILETMGEAELIWSDGKYKLHLQYPEVWRELNDALSLGSFANSNPVTIGAPTVVSQGQVVQYPAGASSDADLYIFNGNWNVFSTTTPPLDVGGSINAYWAKYTTTITDDDIIGDADISYTGDGSTERLNFYTVRYLNEAKNWEEDTVSWPPKYDDGVTPGTNESSVFKYYSGEDNGIILEANTFQSGDTSYHHAMSTAEGVVRSSRATTTYKFSLPRSFIRLEPGDFVKLTSYVLGIPGELMRVTELAVGDDGNIQLTCVKYDARNLAWNAPDYEVVAQRNIYTTDIPQVRNLTFDRAADVQTPTGGTLSWSRPNDSRVTNFLIKLTYRPIAGASELNTAWIEIGSTTSTSFILPQLSGRPLTAAVVSQTSDGQTAPRYNIRTGSRWPLVALEPISAYAPIVVEVIPRHVKIPQLNVSGSPGVGYTTISVTRDGTDIATPENGYSAQWLDRDIDANPALLEEGYASMTVTGTQVSIQLAGNKPPRSGTLVLGVTVNGLTFRRNVDFSYVGALLAPVVLDTTISPKPTGFSVTAGLSWVMVETNNPLDSFLIKNTGESFLFAALAPYYINGGYEKTEVWVATTLPGAAAPSIGSAQYLTEFSGQNTVISAEHATAYYVWVRWVARNGTPSELVGPLVATTGIDVSPLLRVLEDKLSVDQLNVALSTLVETTVPLHQTMFENVVANIGGGAYTTEVKTQILGNDLGNMSQQYTVKLDANGYASGFGLANTSSSYDGLYHSRFLVKADNFSVASPGIGVSNLFTVLTSAQWIDGVLVQPGMYINNAFIHKANIDIAQIGDASITTLKVAGHNITTSATIYPGIVDNIDYEYWVDVDVTATVSLNFLTAPQDVVVFGGFEIAATGPGYGHMFLIVDGAVVASSPIGGPNASGAAVMFNYNPGIGSHTFRLGISSQNEGAGEYHAYINAGFILATLR